MSLLLLEFAGVCFIAEVVGADAGWRKVDDSGEEHSAIHIVGIVNTHAEYHKTHGECGDEEVCLEPVVLSAEEVYPDAGHVAAEEEVFCEGRIVRVNGILEEEIAEGDDAGGGLEGYHEDTCLAHYGNKKMHLDNAEDSERLVEVGDDEGEQ